MSQNMLDRIRMFLKPMQLLINYVSVCICFGVNVSSVQGGGRMPWMGSEGTWVPSNSADRSAVPKLSRINVA